MTRPALVTFDCYGTLIDWYGGLKGTLAKVAGPGADLHRLCERYVALEVEVEAGPYVPYREVMARSLEALLQEEGLPLPPEGREALAGGLPRWPPHPEVPAALRELARGTPVAILSNIDDDLLDASVRLLGVEPAHRVTAEQVRSYKPAPAHFQEILGRTGHEPRQILHVGASVLHDMVPAREMGMHHVWINRYDDPVPGWLPAGRVLPDLSRLPAVAASIDIDAQGETP